MNKKNNTFKIGDKIVHFGKVYHIFKKKKDKIFFRRYFKTPKNKNVIRSIPLKNINQAGIRKPLSKEKINDLFKSVLRRRTKKIKKTVKAKETLNENNLSQSLEIVKNLIHEKAQNSNKLTFSKRNLFKASMKRVQEEIAYSFNISLTEAEEKIIKILKPKK